MDLNLQTRLDRYNEIHLSFHPTLSTRWKLRSAYVTYSHVNGALCSTEVVVGEEDGMQATVDEVDIPVTRTGQYRNASIPDQYHEHPSS